MNYDMNENPIELTIGMREGKPYDIDKIQDFNKLPNNEYREDKCGIDLLEPYCSSTCPHDCISGQWESVHPKTDFASQISPTTENGSQMRTKE